MTVIIHRTLNHLFSAVFFIIFIFIEYFVSVSFNAYNPSTFFTKE